MNKFEEVAEQTLSQVLEAKNAKTDTIYLTYGDFKKIEIHKVNSVDGDCLSVTVSYCDESEGVYKRTTISGGTKLIPFDQTIYEKFSRKTSKTSSTKTPSEKAPKEKKAPEPKMSDIINPMIIADEDPEKIADAVIEKFPAKASERKALVQQIKGPRRLNLIKAGKLAK